MRYTAVSHPTRVCMTEAHSVCRRMRIQCICITSWESVTLSLVLDFLSLTTLIENIGGRYLVSCWRATVNHTHQRSYILGVSELYTTPSSFLPSYAPARMHGHYTTQPQSPALTVIVRNSQSQSLSLTLLLSILIYFTFGR